MSPIQLHIEGKSGRIDVRALTITLSNLVAYLSDIDRGLSSDSRGTLDWYVTEMKVGGSGSRGGLQCRLSPVARETDRDLASEVTALGVEGLGRVETESGTPAYLSLDGMNQLRRMVGVIGRFGVTGLRVSGASQAVHLTPRAAASVTELIRPRRRSLGSIEGVLEMISVHKKPHFTLYSTVTKKAVSCNFVEEEFLPLVKDSLGHRVSVRGSIHSNVKGEPLFVNVERIRHLRSLREIAVAAGVPDAADLTPRGTNPGFTGGMASEQYLQSLRTRTESYGETIQKTLF